MGKRFGSKTIHKAVGFISNIITDSGKPNIPGGQGTQSTPSGKGDSPLDQLIMTAIGGLFGKPEGNNATTIQQAIKSNKTKTHGRSLGELIIGLQGGMSDDDFKKFYEHKKDFFNSAKTTGFFNQFKTMSESVISFTKNDAEWINNLAKAIQEETTKPKNKDKNEEEEANIKVEGGDDFSKILEAIQGFELTPKTKKSLEELADLTGKDGVISVIYDNIIELNKKNVNFDAFKENLKRMDDATKESVELGKNVDEEQLKKSANGMIKFSEFILGVIAIGGLFIIVGLLGNLLDYNAILKFGGLLLAFLVGVTAVFVLANKLLQDGTATVEGIKDYVYLLIVSAGILLTGGLLMNFINITALAAFTATLLLFLLGLTGVYALMNKASKNVMHGVRDFAHLVIVSAAILILGGMLNQFIPFEDVLGFTFKLGFFLLMLTGIYALMNMASKNTMEGVRDFTILVIASSIILFLGALFNHMISFEDVIGFTLKLGLFLLMLTGIFALWNLLKAGVAEGIKDAVIAVGLAAFILFLGAATYKYLKPSDIMGFIFYLGILLFGIVVVMLAASLAMRLSGGSKSTVVRDSIFLVVSAAFIMFLGAVAYKYIDKSALWGFILTFDFFITSLIMILMPLIVAAGIFDKGSEVIKSVSIFVGLAAAVMLIGGGLIMMFPDLLWSIPLFILLFDFFLGSLTLILIPLIAASSIFSDAKDVLREIEYIIMISTACMMLGGGLIVMFPDLAWAIPLFVVLLDAMVAGIAGIMIWLAKKLNKATANNAKNAMRGIEEVILISSISFGILALVYKYIQESGGIGEYMLLVVTVVGAITALALLMVHITGKGKLSTEKAVQRGIMAINGVAIAVGIMSGAFFVLGKVQKMILANGGLGTFEALVWTLVGVLGVLTAGIVAAALVLGNGVTTTMAYIAIGVILAAAGAFAIVCGSILMIAHALKVLSSIKSFDMMPLVKSVATIMLLVNALAPLALAAPIIAATSLALLSLTTLVSKMAEAVKEYADLKIAIYNGTEKVGYRSLTSKDFQEAGKNISEIVTTLTKGVMQAYKAHPEWYENSINPLWALGGPIGLITGAIVAGASDTPLVKVVKQSKLLVPLITQFAEAVKDYADLKIKIYKGTEHIGYRHLSKRDFKQAAENVSLTVTSLTEGIMMAYKAHPEWYGTHLFSGAGVMNIISNLFSLLPGQSSNAGTPLERVISHSMKLGPLISKIAEAVEEVANLKFANKWDEKGQPISYKVMRERDFQNASTNIKLVLETLTNGVMTTYDAHPEWYGTELFSWAGAGNIISNLVSLLPGQSSNAGTPLERVISHNIKLATLISKVAESIKDYTELKFATDWDDHGKPIKFKIMKDQDFEAAGNNISKVLETLGTGVMTVYKNNTEWFESTDTGIFGSGDTPMEKVIKINTKLAKLISIVAASVKDYADLRMPDYDAPWEDGRPTKYKQMDLDDFKNAGENIGRVVTAAALGLMGYDPEGKPTSYQTIIKKYMMSDDDDVQEEFELILENSQKIGNIISGMADNISKYAKMLVPDEWDPKTGTPTHYVKMDSKMMEEAGEGIGKIITGVATALVNLWTEEEGKNDKKQLFGWDPEKQEFKEDSPIKHIIDACMNMGSVISGIANGLSQYAQLKIPKKWDKYGNPIDFDKFDEPMFKTAADHIGTVITTLAGAFKNTYNNNKELFNVRMKKEGGILGFGGTEVPAEEQSPFEKIVDASVKMATVISEIAKALTLFADKKVIGKNEEIISITNDTIEVAKKAIIGILITTAAVFKFLTTDENTKDLFESETLTNVVEPISMMMTAVGTMATAVQDLAMLKVPISWDNQGNPTKYRKMSETDFTEASNNIYKILTTLGDVFLTIAADPRMTWVTGASVTSTYVHNYMGKNFVETTGTMTTEGRGEGVIEVIEGMSTLATILSVMSGCIYGYATMRFPIGTNKDGEVKLSKPLTTMDITNAQTNIKTVIMSLFNAMNEVMLEPVVINMTSKEGSEKLANTTDAINNLISTIQGVMDGVKEMTDSESARNLEKVNKQLGRMIPVFSSIIGHIQDLLTLLFEGDISKINFQGELTLDIKTQNSFSNLIIEYSPKFRDFDQKFSDFLSTIRNVSEQLGNLYQPLHDVLPQINSLYIMFKKERFNEKLNEIINDIGEMLRTVSMMADFDKMFKSNEMYNMPESTMSLMGNDLNNNISNIKNKIITYTDFIVFITEKISLVNNSISNLGTVDNDSFIISINMFFDAIYTIQRSIESVSGSDLDMMIMTITQYSNALEIMINILDKAKSVSDTNFSTLIDGIKSLNEMIMGIMNTDIDTMVNSLSQYSNAFEILFNIIERIEEISIDNFTMLVDGIINLNNALILINQKSLNNLKQQNEEIAKLVKTINSVNLTNLIKLNQFANSMNTLAARMGNLDKLTEAIGTKLTNVLDKLVQRLEHAEETIVKADEIQKRRHELIQKAAQDIKVLMDTPMRVEVAPSAEMMEMAQSSTSTVGVDTTTPPST